METAQAVGVGDGGHDTADGVGVCCPAFVDLDGGNLLDRYVLDHVLENVESVRSVGLKQDEAPPLSRAGLPLGGDGLIQGGVYPVLEFPLPVAVRVHEPHHRKGDGCGEGRPDGCAYEDECASALHGLHGPVVCVCGAVPRREWLGCRAIPSLRCCFLVPDCVWAFRPGICVAVLWCRYVWPFRFGTCVTASSRGIALQIYTGFPDIRRN